MFTVLSLRSAWVALLLPVAGTSIVSVASGKLRSVHAARPIPQIGSVHRELLRLCHCTLPWGNVCLVLF